MGYGYVCGMSLGGPGKVMLGIERDKEGEREGNVIESR